ncbi:MAG: cytochrome-c peroxidase [Cytophagales bacterium]|nr:MAG: cytochrome-c peroxidase [Cytophagales bacterium]TAF59481.1 MAG: cytochrome-c peroxidase [Cytophagales bacterium]
MWLKRCFQIISFGFAVSLFVIACKGEKEIPLSNEPYKMRIPYYFGDYLMPVDNPLTEGGVALGRMLFYEKKLSVDNSISCGSCHQQSKAFTDGRAFSQGFEGRQTDVGAMSIANLLWEVRLTWTGKAEQLEKQAIMPMEHPNEMNQAIAKAVSKLQSDSRYPVLFARAFGTDKISSDLITKALAQFQRTLISQDSPYDKFLRGEYNPTDAEMRGMRLFFNHPDPIAGIRGANCGDCHLPVRLAGNNLGFSGFHNNGLDTDDNLKEGLMAVTGNPKDKGKFKAPTLRNIMKTAPYMHDGRFKTIEEVLEHYDKHVKRSATLDQLIVAASNEPRFNPGDPIKLGLTKEEKADILTFLKMLTDEKFLTNPDYSDPF